MSAPSPLVEIRAAELAAARSVATAEQEAAQRIADARTDAIAVVEAARARGRALADQRYDAALDAAREQAADIAHAVDRRIAELRANVEPELDRLADAMLGVVLPKPEV